MKCYKVGGPKKTSCKSGEKTLGKPISFRPFIGGYFTPFITTWGPPCSKHLFQAVNNWRTPAHCVTCFICPVAWVFSSFKPGKGGRKEDYQTNKQNPIDFRNVRHFSFCCCWAISELSSKRTMMLVPYPTLLKPQTESWCNTQPGGNGEFLKVTG